MKPTIEYIAYDYLCLVMNSETGGEESNSARVEMDDWQCELSLSNNHNLIINLK